ncbi:MAG: EF-hand domain-containing protein [Pseudomonadota bacterium]
MQRLRVRAARGSDPVRIVSNCCSSLWIQRRRHKRFRVDILDDFYSLPQFDIGAIMKKLILIPALAFAGIATGAAAENPNEKAAAENFKQADANDDGKLSKSEFRKFIDLNAEDNLGRAATVKSFGMYDTAFGRVDANKDGYVTSDELKATARG